jgi:polysaccharide pyruvyl transferase WcaK-like protein
MIDTTPAFFATPATVTEIAHASAVVALIGGYDGSGNYGDIAQLDAALRLLERFEPALLVAPVLERSRLADHRAQLSEFLHPPERALFFDPGEGREDDLQPVAGPVDLAFAACYLYGGGYLNSAWGERKLAMLRAAEGLIAGGGAAATCRISSGLQIDAEWIASLSSAHAEALRAFEPLGVRDPASGEAFAELAPETRVRDTADDAIGLLRHLPAADGDVDSDRGILVNLHVAEHPWATDRPDAMAGFYADLIATLASCVGRPVVAQPLIAYADRWVSERQAIERLAAACAARGVELAEARVLRPASLPSESREIRRAALTVSCSYHVALTSLLLEVPTAILCDNAYYRQKTAGLSDAFGLPAAFTPTSSADPAAAAREIAAVIFNEGRLTDFTRRLRVGGSRLRETRAAAEAEVLTALGSAAATSLNARLGEISERLRERSTEPAELLAQLAMLQPENDTSRQRAESPRPSTDDGAAEQMLAELLGSRSWRMTAPLRRIAARLQRR